VILIGAKNAKYPIGAITAVIPNRPKNVHNVVLTKLIDTYILYNYSMSELDENSVVNELTETLKTLTNTTKVVELRNIFVKKYLTPLYAQIASAPTEEKAKIGQTAENLKRKIFKIIDEKMVSVAANNPTHQVNYDITLNTSDFAAGGLNPITLVIDEIATYFRKLNFTIQSGQEVLDIKYGFDHLNISEHHPSRDTSETFYVSDTHILRTQNTSSSAMFMENNSHHDIRIMNYGSVYRNDDDDATHSHQFNQVDFV
jgi:phenylalanyl-tRNA synthetase alpha chain